MKKFEQMWNRLFKTKTMQTILNLVNAYNDKRISEYSAQASYFLILSVFPFIMLILTLLRFIPIDYNITMEYIVNFIPPSWQETVRNLVDEILLRTNIIHTLATAAATLWASSKSISALMRGMNNMYEKEETRFFITVRLNALLNTFLLVSIILVSLVLMIFGDRLMALAQHYWPDIGIIIQSVLNMRTLFFFCSLIMILMMMYKLLPNRKIPLLWELPGAVFSTLGWYLFSKLFAVYVNHNNRYYFMYGSLTTIVIAVIWVYICINILYIGAGINLYLEKYFFDKNLSKKHFYRKNPGSRIKKG